MSDIKDRNNDYKKRPLQRIGIVDKTSGADHGALLLGGIWNVKWFS